MSEETKEGLTQEEMEKKAAEEAKAAEAEAKAKAEEAQKAMTAELQAERQRRQAAEEELERSKGTQSTNDDDPEKVFQRLMEEDRAKKAKSAREEALKEFRNSVRELSEENDPAGLVYGAFERELNKFNLSDLSTKEEFTARFKEVHEFMNRGKAPSQSKTPTYEGGEGTPGSSPKEDDSAHLTDVEKRLIKDMGWDKERYLNQKAKRPHYVASLLQYRS
jgi:hypothetical protein